MKRKIYAKVRGYEGAGLGSPLIRWFTRNKFTHVSLVFKLGDCYEEVEAIQGKGVIAHEPHKQSRRKVFTEFDLPLTYEQILDTHILVKSLVGSKYDWAGIKSFLVHRKKHSEDKWFCSELVAYALLKAGYPVSRLSPHLESPATVCSSLRLTDPV